MAGFLLAYLMMFLGVLAATDSLVREAGPAGKDANYIIPLTDIVIFATLIFFALRSRCRPSAPKRHIFLVTASLLIAVIARWPLRTEKPSRPHWSPLSSRALWWPTIWGQRAGLFDRPEREG
jgi:cell division protein FtsW (lipid II flippase)